jgi:Zn-dependent protease
MLKFPLLDVPVTVHWSFAIVAFFGIGRYDTAPEIGAWTAAVFLAVLLHESGHAFTARAYGATGVTMTLFALGGYTQWVPRETMSPGKRFIVSAAGSAVGIAAGLLILGLGRGGGYQSFPGWGDAFLATFILVGLIWGVLNWIPLLPLDGGHMLNHALAIFWPKRADNVATVVSTVVGVGLIATAFYFQQTFLAIFLVFILLSGLRSRPRPTRQVPSDEAPTIAPHPPAEPTPTEPEQEPPAFPI